MVWGLILLAGVMYLGMLELRFRVDILHDGGVFDQLFVLKGATTLTSSAAQHLHLSELNWEYFVVHATELWVGLSANLKEAVEMGLQLMR